MRFYESFHSKLIFGNAPTLKLPQKKSLLTKKFFCAIILKILQGIIIASTQYHFQINLCGNKQIKKETVKKKNWEISFKSYFLLFVVLIFEKSFDSSRINDLFLFGVLRKMFIEYNFKKSAQKICSILIFVSYLANI